MSNEIKSTVPKPFIFILMPFDEKFNDTWKSGIKGAAEDAGAYAERVDEQIFNEGILDRLFNQINKADVIVADTTDRNPNVFYEVGYAHALGKIVILLTQNPSDIPFDLKQRQHLVYAGNETLRKELTGRLIWAINESKKQGRKNLSERFVVSISGVEIPEAGLSLDMPTLSVERDSAGSDFIDISIRNDSVEPTPAINHVYLFTSANSKIVPGIIEEKTVYRESSAVSSDGVPYWHSEPATSYVNKPLARTSDSATSKSPDDLTRQYHLETTIHPLPPGALDHISIKFIEFPSGIKELLRFRIHSSTNTHDFPFNLGKL